MDTHPDIVDFLIVGLTSWLNSNSSFSLDSSVDLPLLNAFKIQLQLGWNALLLGLLTSPLLICQHNYYHCQGSRRSGNRWGTLLTGKLWNIIFQIWMNRNHSLHETLVIDHVSGQDQLRNAIILEHALGIKDLPTVYKPYFSSLPIILSRSIKYQKQWFLVIRSARESSHSFSHYDNFSINASLWSWIDLSPIS